MLSTTLLLLLLPQAGSTLATFQVGRDQVPAILPANPPNIEGTGPSFDFEGDRYEYVGGRVVRHPGNSDWDAFAARFAAAHAKAASAPKTWRVLVVPFLRGDLLERADNGLLTQRRGYFDETELPEVKRSIALFSALVETATDGAICVKADIAVEGMSANAEASPVAAYDGRFIQDYFGPRINGAGFEADDGVFRGPFDSVVGLYSAPSRTVSFGDVNGNPVSMVPMGLVQTMGAPESLANALFVEFRRHLIFAVQQRGFGGSVFAVPTVTDRDRGCPLSDSFRLPAGWQGDQPYEGYAGAAYAPQAVSAGVVAGQIPRLGPALMDRFGFQLKDPPIGTDVAMSEASGKQTLIVAPSLAELALRRVQPQSATSIGWAGDHLLVQGPSNMALQFPVVASTLMDSAPLRRAFEVGETEALPRGGRMDAKSFSDPDRGAVAQVSLAGGTRRGWIRLLGAPRGKHLFDGRTTDRVEFWIKAVKPGPMAIQFVSADSTWAGATYGLFATPKPSMEAAPGVPLLAVPTDDAWHKVVVKLDSQGTGPMPVAAIDFCSHPGMDFAEPETAGGTYWIDDLAVGSTDEPTAVMPIISFGASASSDAPLDRALYAASITSEPTTVQWPTLRTLLGDPSDWVRLNAARVFSQYRDPASENVLIDLSKNLNFRISHFALEGLAAIDSPSAWAAIRNAMNVGPFDHNKSKAVELVARKATNKDAGALSVVIGSRTWGTRLAGARAIGTVKGSEAAIVLMAFLQDDDPAVRLAAAQGAVATPGVVGQRMLWASVNDPSDAVRAACAYALARSKAAQLQGEGYKGLKGDGSRARAALLDLLGSSPVDDDHAAIVGCLSDPDPIVRVAALRALHAGKAVSVQELATVLSDPDPRVQHAVLDLVDAGRVKLGPATVEAYKSSADPNVAARAARLAINQ